MEQKENNKEGDFIFCGICSVKVRKDAKYCWKCSADLSTTGPPDWIAEQRCTKSPASSFGRPQRQKRKAMSFESYVKAKASEQQGGCQFRTKKKAKEKDDNTEVTINIGIKQFDEEDLKTVRGKRLPISVLQNATYSTILEKAVTKWKAFERRFDATKQHVLLYEDGTMAQFMPGEQKEFFSLKTYKLEVGKDFKRIVFYLCDSDQFNAYEKFFQEPTSTADESDLGVGESMDEDDSTCSSIHDEQITSDEILAVQLQEKWNNSPTSGEEIVIDDLKPIKIPATESNHCAYSHISNYKDVVEELASKVKRDVNFFIVTRRKAPFSRIISLWQRQTSKSHPTNVLRVHYSGESGIDDGAIALEFLERCIHDMEETMFPNAAPIASSHHVQNGGFRTCGEIAAVSLAQGGPPPCILEQCCFESTFKDIDMTNITGNDLTAKERKVIEKVRLDCTQHIDLIVENGYTGLIKEENIEAITRSLEVSFVSRRRLYMKEFMIGLGTYDLDKIITEKPLQCQPLFVVGDLKKQVEPDADYLFSLMEPQYSREGSSRKCIEEDIMDFLQDTMIAIENGNMTGHVTAVATNYNEGDEKNSDEENANEERSEFETEFEIPSLSVAGLMGWMTGSQHKPIGRQKIKILVYFNHDCLKNNPKHSVCFPIISACGRTITFPVSHMNTEDTFRQVFTMAYCKGHKTHLNGTAILDTMTSQLHTDVIQDSSTQEI